MYEMKGSAEEGNERTWHTQPAQLKV